jgi:hypothetical protein
MKTSQASTNKVILTDSSIEIIQTDVGFKQYERFQIEKTKRQTIIITRMASKYYFFTSSSKEA